MFIGVHLGFFGAVFISLAFKKLDGGVGRAGFGVMIIPELI